MATYGLDDKHGELFPTSVGVWVQGEDCGDQSRTAVGAAADAAPDASALQGGDDAFTDRSDLGI